MRRLFTRPSTDSAFARACTGLGLPAMASPLKFDRPSGPVDPGFLPADWEKRIARIGKQEGIAAARNYLEKFGVWQSTDRHELRYSLLTLTYGYDSARTDARELLSPQEYAALNSGHAQVLEQVTRQAELTRTYLATVVPAIRPGASDATIAAAVDLQAALEQRHADLRAGLKVIAQATLTWNAAVQPARVAAAEQAEDLAARAIAQQGVDALNAARPIDVPRRTGTTPPGRTH